MGEFDIRNQLEMYSNAILAFMVFQGLTFCYYVGTSQQFNQILKSTKVLSFCLVIAFICVWAMAVVFNLKIAAHLKAAVDEPDKKVIAQIYFGKLLAICLFGALPLFVILKYGVR